MSWLGAVTGRSAETSSGKHLTSGNSLAGISPQATRSLIVYRLDRWSGKDGRGISRRAAWKRSPTAMISGQRRASCVPVTYSVGAPPIDAQRAVRSPLGPGQPETHRRNLGETWARHASSCRPASAGMTTTSPANQDMPCPPPSGTGRDPGTPKAASTAGGGNSTDKTYPGCRIESPRRQRHRHVACRASSGATRVAHQTEPAQEFTAARVAPDIVGGQ